MYSMLGLWQNNPCQEVNILWLLTTCDNKLAMFIQRFFFFNYSPLSNEMNGNVQQKGMKMPLNVVVKYVISNLGDSTSI